MYRGYDHFRRRSCLESNEVRCFGYRSTITLTLRHASGSSILRLSRGRQLRRLASRQSMQRIFHLLVLHVNDDAHSLPLQSSSLHHPRNPHWRRDRMNLLISSRIRQDTPLRRPSGKHPQCKRILPKTQHNLVKFLLCHHPQGHLRSALIRRVLPAGSKRPFVDRNVESMLLSRGAWHII